MPSNADSRIENLDARVLVGEPDRFLDIDSKMLAQEGDLIGKGDVDVAVGILDELDELGRAVVGGEQFSLDESPEQFRGPPRGAVVDSSDHAGVEHGLRHDVARQNALRAMGQQELSPDPEAALLQNRLDDIHGGQRRDRGFDDHEIPGPKEWNYGFRGRDDGP